MEHDDVEQQPQLGSKSVWQFPGCSLFKAGYLTSRKPQVSICKMGAITSISWRVFEGPVLRNIMQTYNECPVIIKLLKHHSILTILYLTNEDLSEMLEWGFCWCCLFFTFFFIPAISLDHWVTVRSNVLSWLYVGPTLWLLNKIHLFLQENQNLHRSDIIFRTKNGTTGIKVISSLTVIRHLLQVLTLDRLFLNSSGFNRISIQKKCLCTELKVL